MEGAAAAPPPPPSRRSDGTEPAPQAIQTKRCRMCDRILPRTRFYRRKNGILNSYCHECQTIRTKRYYREHVERNRNKRPRVSNKNCRRCRQLLPASEFTKDMSRPTGLSSMCRACAKDDGHSRPTCSLWNDLKKAL